MWRAAIRTSPLAIGLVQLSTTRFVEMSTSAAELLKTTPERGSGLDYLSVTDRPREAVQLFRLVRERVLDGIKGRRRFERPDGSTVELQLTGWAIRSVTGPDLALWLASEGALSEHPAPGVDRIDRAISAGAEFDRAEIIIDDHWRIADITSEGGAVLGRPRADVVSASIFDLTHVDDLAALLFAFARATTDPSADVRIRLRRQDGSWRTLLAVVTMLESEGTLPFSLVAMPVADPEGPDTAGASQLAGHLRRIASQIETAGVLAPLIETAAALGAPATAALSPRQWEIASRLIQGQRVATIAKEMYLSQSTVRNHLSAIFQKFGVHSQLDLLALWRTRGQANTHSD
jgi:DNA-binding CsgD family transcriptional regulator/PAS domain-containing protein